MEEDNAGDILKWLLKESTKLDCKGTVQMVIGEGMRKTRWEAILHGNLLAFKSLDELANEPILLVCEKLEIAKNLEELQLILRHCNKEYVMHFVDESDLDKWMVKLSVCSHKFTQAEYDQMLCTHYTQKTDVTDAAITPYNYFLASPISKEMPFSLFQSASVPNKQIICQETMFESKLSILIPQEMLKLSMRWTTELRDELLDKLWRIRNSSIVEVLHMAIRHLNSNIEIHSQAIEFLDSYTGPYFRPSTEKYRVSFLYVPTNLHVQFFGVSEKQLAHFVTVGALAALPLRFSNGGLYRLRNKFGENLTPNSIDHTNEMRFHQRRETIQALKRKIGELSRKIDTEWLNDDTVRNSKLAIELFTATKHIRETISDMISSFPNIHNLVDSLRQGGLAQMEHKNGEAVPKDTLNNQLEFLDAQFDSLNSKIAASAIGKGDGEEQHQRDDRQREATNNDYLRSSFHLALDALHHLALSLELGQMLSLVQCLRNRSQCQSFFHLQLRHDALLSQAITITVTALLTAVHSPDLKLHSPAEWLMTHFSFLSCYGDEQGMMEDAFEILQLLPTIAAFRFIERNSSVSQTCIPSIEGFRTDLKVSIPIHADVLQRLPDSMRDWFRPKIAFWNIGINHEASLAASIGGTSLEEQINRAALQQTTEFVLNLLSSSEEEETLDNRETINRLLADLQMTVSMAASRKNTAIFPLAMALTHALGGICILSCKSGKDRTSMAITLEEGRILKETQGISNQQVQEIVECLRKNGVRRENCRKNVGKPMFSFSPFQMSFLPKEFRPPLGTFTNMIAS